MTDIVRGKVIGDVSSVFRARGQFTMTYGGGIIQQTDAEIHVWRSCSMNGREIVDSILADEWKPETSSTGVECSYTIDSLDEIEEL